MEQLTVINKDTKCHFCGWSKDNYLKYGPIYKLGKVKAHYYCVLLSNRLIQNGNDDEGILGFLLSDIKNELQRTVNVLCCYCQKGNATISCAATKCRRSFHLPCGLKRGSSHQFVHQFKSFCHVHKLVQNIPLKIFKEACKTEIICCICQEKINFRAKSMQNNLWAPCCLKTWYHRDCVQKLAHSAGYFCRCAACNDSKKFNEWMQKYGIFIPQQDASWELVPNAFQELLFKYSNCDAEDCKCPRGRQSSIKNTIWEIVLCESCGSQGIHITCGNLKFLNPEWECPVCQQITKNLKPSSTTHSSKKNEDSSVILKSTEVRQKKRRRCSEENYVLDKRKKRKTNAEEDEIEVDVETIDEGAKVDETLTDGVDASADVEDRHHEETVGDAKPTQEMDLQTVLKLIKPGPLSYKLAEIRKIYGELLIPEEIDIDALGGKSTPSVTELIELSESDEKDSDSEVELVEEMKNRTTEELKSIVHYRVMKNRALETEKQQEGKDFSSGTSSLSLENFDMVAALSLEAMYRPQDNQRSSEDLTYLPEARNYVDVPIFPPPNTQSNIYTLECKPDIAVLMREQKEIVEVIDDEVIIIKD